MYCGILNPKQLEHTAKLLYPIMKCTQHTTRVKMCRIQPKHTA